jgi:hypothetical protein
MGGEDIAEVSIYGGKYYARYWLRNLKLLPKEQKE